MPNNKQIFIFTGPIRSGKTTALTRWAAAVAAKGILTPDNETGRRMLHCLSSNRQLALELPAYTEEDGISVGRFFFSRKAFGAGQQQLLRDMEEDPPWLLIDEVGKLELQRSEGFEPALSHILQRYQSGLMQGRLLLVVRDSLLEEALRYYNLQGCTIATKPPRIPG